MKTRRIIVNNDYYNIFQVEPPIEDQDIFDAVDKIAGTQVDTLTLDVPTVLADSVVDPDIRDLYRHPEADTCLNNMEVLAAAGKDPFEMILQRAHAAGLEFMGSLRMNDTHYKDQVFSPFVHRFYYDHVECRLGPEGSREGAEFDYRKSAVREYYLERVRNALERYDLDGFELNFTRNCRFFPSDHGEECAPVMTQFVRDVKAVLTEWGERRGKRLSLGVIVPYSLNGCRLQGLDLPTLARLELVDMVCLLTPFLATMGHDVHDAKLKLPGVQVYAGCDRNLAYGFDGSTRVVPLETYRAMAMDYWRQGADGIYLFNVMSWTMNYAKSCAAVKRHGGQGETEDGPIDYDRELMNEVGSLETLEGLDKLYVAMGTDDVPSRLPVTVPAGGEAGVRVRVGDDIAAAARSGKLVGVELQTVSPDCSDYGDYTVKLNGVDLSRQYAFVPYAEKPGNALLFPEPARRGALPPLENVRRHAVNPVYLNTGLNAVTIKSYGPALTVTDVELAVRYRR